MSVIIRLQNLPWSANALDIRGFFRGLSILDGGVNIVGGEMGDAFIAFSTDEDARQAMMMDGGKIKEVGVRLSLSSRAEMQKVIEVARQSTAAAFGPITAPAAAAPAAAAAVVVPPAITTAAVANPVVETPIVVTAAPTLTSPLSNLLTQQMLQQKIRQQEQENLQQQLLEQQLLEHKKQLLQQQLTGKTLLVGDLAQQLTFQQLQQRMQIGQEQKPQNQPLPSLMQNPLKDPRRGMDLPGEKPQDRMMERDRRGRDRRSRSRSRERRRSRSRDRGRRRDGREGRDGRDGRDRRERSRSRERRDRERDRRRRERGTRSRERSYERERNSKDRTRDDGKDPGKANAPVYTANTQIWDIPPNIPNVPNTAQLLSIQPVLEPNTASQSSLSPEDRSNLMKLNEKRDLSAFQSGGWKGGRGYGNYRENEEDSDNSCCVRMSGMDLTTGYGEIRRFFHGLSINMNGIKMINDKTGKRTGIAFIEFVRSDAQRSAVQRDGQSIRGHQVRVTAATKEEFDREVDSYRPPRGSERARNFSSQEYPGMLERSTEYDNSTASRCLKVTNLPSHATQQDIIKMYSNYSLDEIVMVQENSRILTAYVRFFRMDDAKSALNLPAGLFVYRGLEVSVCDEDKFNNMLVYHGGGCPGRNIFSERRLDSSKDTSQDNSQENSQDYSQENADSLPSADDKEENANESMESDVLHVAEDEEPEQDQEDEQEEDVQEVYEINDDEVVPADVEVSMDVVSQESNDECPPVFKKQEDPRLLKTTLNESIQSTFNQSSLDPRLNRQPPPPLMEIRDPRLNPNPMGFKKTDCVVMSNLEPKITDRDVVDFFSDVGLIPLRVHILLNTMGQPSGDCFVEFTTPEDAEKALTKHRTHLGQNEVTVEAIVREKVEEILNSFDEPSPAFEVDPPEEVQQQPMMPTMPQFQMRGGFGSGGMQQQQQQQSSMMRMRGPYPPPRGPPMGPNGPMGYTPRPPFGMRMNGNGMMMNAGRVVNMENLPYRATYDDILEFFGDFKLTPADIMRRFNDKGQATGDARVRFMNPAEAMRAVDTRNQARIMGRPIYLTLLDN